MSSGTTMLSASSRLIDSAKSLAMNPRDSSAWQLLASHSKAVSDAMKKLLAALKLVKTFVNYIKSIFLFYY